MEKESKRRKNKMGLFDNVQNNLIKEHTPTIKKLIVEELKTDETFRNGIKEALK